MPGPVSSSPIRFPQSSHHKTFPSTAIKHITRREHPRPIQQNAALHSLHYRATDPRGSNPPSAPCPVRPMRSLSCSSKSLKLDQIHPFTRHCFLIQLPIHPDVFSYITASPLSSRLRPRPASPPTSRCTRSADFQTNPSRCTSPQSPSPLLPEGEVGPKGRIRILNKPDLSPLLPEGEVGPKGRMRVLLSPQQPTTTPKTTHPAALLPKAPPHFSPREKSAQWAG